MKTTAVIAALLGVAAAGPIQPPAAHHEVAAAPAAAPVTGHAAPAHQAAPAQHAAPPQHAAPAPVAQAPAQHAAPPQHAAPAPVAQAPAGHKAAAPAAHAAAGKGAHIANNGPFQFTSTYNLIARPDQVVDPDNVAVAGEAGSIGYYNYGIDVHTDTICYNITLLGVTGPYDSPAVTATHIHEAAAGQAGPPRIAFPNPEPADSGPEVVKRSAGCIQGPFTTGIEADDGSDTGAGFTLAQIEANPEGFFTDSHTVVSVDGVVRAQLELNPAA